MEKEMKAEEKEITDQLTNLSKKTKYLEKQLNEAQGQLRDIVSSNVHTLYVVRRFDADAMRY